MIPITLDPARLRLGVTGAGPMALSAAPAALPPLDMRWIADVARQDERDARNLD